MEESYRLKHSFMGIFEIVQIAANQAKNPILKK